MSISKNKSDGRTLNKYLISLIVIPLFLFYSCKEKSNQSNFKGKKVLLSNLSIPKDYTIIGKYHYSAEGQSPSKYDSIYILKKGKIEIELSVRYYLGGGFSKTEDIETTMNYSIEELVRNNKTTKIHNKKINKQKSIWYIKYSLNDLLYLFWMERETNNYIIKIETYDNNLSLNDIEFFYNELCKFED